MAEMTVRSTYALDPPTALCIRELAAEWNTSQAEVIRRSVRMAAEQQKASVKKMTPAQVIEHWRSLPADQVPTLEQLEQARIQLRAERHEADELREERLDRARQQIVSK